MPTIVKTTGKAVGIAEEIPEETTVKSTPEKSTRGVLVSIISPPFHRGKNN